VKFRWKILLGLASLLGISVLAAVVYHFQLKMVVERYKAELKAQGEPMELAEVIPPRIPPDKNSAPQFLAAVGLFTTNKDFLTTNWLYAMRGVAPGKAQIMWQQKTIRDDGTTNSWEDLAQALEKDKEGFRQLVAITNSPLFDFGLHYEQRFEMRITNLVVEKKTAQRLSAKTLNDLLEGQSEPAAANIRAMLALVEGTRDERTAISQLVRIAIAQIACGTTWEFLQSSNLTDGQLAGLQADWNRLDFLQAMTKVLPVEREGGLTTVAHWRSSNAAIEQYFDLSIKAREGLGQDVEEENRFEKIKQGSQIFLWRYWWSYPDELRCLKGYEVLLESMKLAITNGSFQVALKRQNTALDQLGISKLNNEFDSIFSGKTDFHAMLSESIVTLAGLSRKVMCVEVAKQVAITAIALKRFQLQHGSYPPNLNALVPEFALTVPRDPVDGEPLRYRLLLDGNFRLYSIGENGKDDNGNPALKNNVEGSTFNWLNSQALDWVWPQPATEAEIESYFNKQAGKPH
jgi:hypothetical protein